MKKVQRKDFVELKEVVQLYFTMANLLPYDVLVELVDLMCHVETCDYCGVTTIFDLRLNFITSTPKDRKEKTNQNNTCGKFFCCELCTEHVTVCGGEDCPYHKDYGLLCKNCHRKEVQEYADEYSCRMCDFDNLETIECQICEMFFCNEHSNKCKICALNLCGWCIKLYNCECS